MVVIPGTFLPSDDDGSGTAREPVTEDPEEPDVPASQEANAAIRAATVMATDGTSNVDLPHVPGGLEGIEKAIGKD